MGSLHRPDEANRHSSNFPASATAGFPGPSRASSRPPLCWVTGSSLIFTTGDRQPQHNFPKTSRKLQKPSHARQPALQSKHPLEK